MRKKALIQALTGTTHIVCENIETDNTAGAMNIIAHPDEKVNTFAEFATEINFPSVQTPQNML